MKNFLFWNGVSFIELLFSANTLDQQVAERSIWSDLHLKVTFGTAPLDLDTTIGEGNDDVRANPLAHLIVQSLGHRLQEFPSDRDGARRHGSSAIGIPVGFELGQLIESLQSRFEMGFHRHYSQP